MNRFTSQIHQIVNPERETIRLEEAVRARAIATANAHCLQCSGTGIRLAKYREVACGCVHRHAFYSCVAKYRRIRFCQGYPDAPRIRLEHSGHGDPQYAFPHSEFLADFDIAARKCLAKEDLLILEHHFIQRGEWKRGLALTKLNRGDYYHRVYAVAERMGGYLATLKPFALYPTPAYLAQRVMAVPRRRGDRGVWEAQTLGAAA